LSQQKEGEKLGSKLKPCPTVAAQGSLAINSVNNGGTLSIGGGNNYPPLATTFTTDSGGQLAYGCPLQDFETQAPFYLDIAASNALEARKWWVQEMNDESEQRTLDLLGFGNLQNYSQETKTELNGKFGKIRTELKNLIGPGTATKKNAVQLTATIGSNMYNSWVGDQLHPARATARSEGAGADYNSCIFLFQAGGRTLYETLKCLAAADPPGYKKHRHVHGSTPTNPHHGMQNHVQSFLNR
jgi:hypothetical protein